MEDKLKQEIVLGERCAIELNATFKMLRICVSIYLVWVLFSLYKQILELFNGAGGAYIQSNFILKYKIIPVAYLLQSIVILIGIYYQFNSFKMQRDALYLSDSTLFVKSYTFFRKGLMASLIATLITILIYVAFKFFGFTSKF
jgi:hypothetical protein